MGHRQTPQNHPPIHNQWRKLPKFAYATTPLYSLHVIFFFLLFSDRLYGKKQEIEERHRHRYEVNPKYIEQLEKGGCKFVGVDVEAERMEVLELESHPYFVAVQYHPEYLSRPMSPSPPFLGLVLASKNKLKSYLARGCRFSPKEQSDFEDSDQEELVKHLETTRIDTDSGCSLSSLQN